MQPIKRYADSRERDAGTALAEARGALEERERQLAELARYHAEYSAQPAQQPGAVDLGRVQNHYAFLGRLQDALRQQRQAIEEARAELERRLAHWQSLRAEAAALGRVVERLQQDERRDADRREQQDHDERALRSPPTSLLRD
jgi:flagellar FliJ protein